MTEVYDQTSRRDFVLAALRSTCLRVKLIENEIAAIGTALKGGFITPDTALVALGRTSAPASSVQSRWGDCG